MQTNNQTKPARERALKQMSGANVRAEEQTNAKTQASRDKHQAKQTERTSKGAKQTFRIAGKQAGKGAGQQGVNASGSWRVGFRGGCVTGVGVVPRLSSPTHQPPFAPFALPTAPRAFVLPAAPQGRLSPQSWARQRPRADLNRDRWIQSPECWPLHHEARCQHHQPCAHGLGTEPARSFLPDQVCDHWAQAFTFFFFLEFSLALSLSFAHSLSGQLD